MKGLAVGAWRRRVREMLLYVCKCDSVSAAARVCMWATDLNWAFCFLAPSVAYQCPKKIQGVVCVRLRAVCFSLTQREKNERLTQSNSFIQILHSCISEMFLGIHVIKITTMHKHENRFWNQKHQTTPPSSAHCFSLTKAVSIIYIQLARKRRNTETNNTRALPSNHNPTYRHAVSITVNFIKKLVCGFLNGVEFLF